MEKLLIYYKDKFINFNFFAKIQNKNLIIILDAAF